MLGASISSGLESIRRLSFNSTPPPPKAYFEAEDPSSPFPNVFINSVIYLERHGLNEEGLLRLTGRLNDVKHIRSLLVDGKTDQLQQTDVHTVASVLKSFFNDSPHSILPEEKYPTFMKKASEDKDLVYYITEVVRNMPVNHQKILHRLILFADRIQANAKVNKMENFALAVILGPMLLRCAAPLSPAQQLTDNGACVKIAYKLLAYHSTIFEGIALNDLNMKEIDDTLKAKTYTEGMRSPAAGSLGRRSYKLIRTQTQDNTSPGTSSSSIATTTTGKSMSSTVTPSNARVFFERAALDMKAIYEVARDHRAGILKEARAQAVIEWRAAKAKADEENKTYKEVEDRYNAKKAELSEATLQKEQAFQELEKLKSFYQITPENKATIHETLQRDEVAHVQELQALSDWREAELQLALYDLQVIGQEKSLIETPHEIAQAALWQAVQELKRLEISDEDAEKWDTPA